MKTWQTPKLIVLVRNDPQEAVLSVCKAGTGPVLAAAVEPSAYYLGCTQSPVMANTPVCLDCSSISAS